MYMGLHIKYRLFFSECNETNFRKILKHQIHAVGAELSHADRQIDEQI
jgi:hypothetical protein